MSESTAEHMPPEIQELMRQQQEIQQKIDTWRKEQEAKRLKAQEKDELQSFVESMSKKRSFGGLKYNLPQPKRLKRCFHNIKVIQRKEEDLAKERAEVKNDCIKHIQDYLDESNTLND